MSAPPGPDGVLVVDKPPGVTSHDVVARVRRGLPRGTRVGHAGTLDPFASGVLLVLLGRGTRAQRFLMALPKEYETVARFGAVSVTGDPEGPITETGVVPEGDLVLPTGLVRQRPPAYSALKIDGERAYRRARRGEDVEVPEREVRVDEFTELWRDGARRAFRIRCGSGTYVRSLVADLGDAYCAELRRTAIGSFRAEDADEDRVVPLEAALAFLPAVELGEEGATAISHGRSVPGAAAGTVRLLAPTGALMALAEEEDGVLRPRVVLRPG